MTHARQLQEEALHYPLADKPESGEVLEIAPGIKWLRLPLPFQLAHINVWLLQDGDGWAVIDTGLGTRTTKEVWKKVFERDLAGASLTRVFVTHLHPDHSGCAGWLCRRFEAGLWMSREEYFLCRLLAADTGHPAPAEGRRFYREAGFPDEALENYIEHYGMFGRVVTAMPESYRRLSEGKHLQIGDHHWEVIVGRGHSPEHACLYCESLNLLIGGDQLLPTISSNISVYPTEPRANPLRDWFDSLDLLERKLPADVLVLPAHGKPFTGAHERVRQLREEHETGLAKLLRMCSQPRRAIDVFPALFKSRITDRNLLMATGEAMSHINYLLESGDITAEQDSDGVNWYQRIAA